MKKTKRVMFFLIVIIALFWGYKGIKRLMYVYDKRAYHRVMEDTAKWDANRPNPIDFSESNFSNSGIENIALVTMVKDEEDIIYENLVWHFCIGFRKFVIVDNNSTDKTLSLIHKFKKETEGKAIVIIMEDPIFEHIQSRIITASTRIVNSVWPEVEWVFPVDADEFWYPNRALDKILADVPRDKDAILVAPYVQRPCVKRDKIDFSKRFYDVLCCQDKNIGQELGKVAIRSSFDVIVMQGNHHAMFANSKYLPQKVSGNILGLYMLHFHIRSVDQVYKKFWNGARANIALKKKEGSYTGKNEGHWDAFVDEVQDKGALKAAIDRFDGYVADEGATIDDTIEFEKAKSFYDKIIGEK
ncbi:MAG: glycosyltransferase family 2 protein [Rickettsiaceae bacterium]|nr:glycosyltransferase family 2 protein [Rickettsiaceae bacterium]